MFLKADERLLSGVGHLREVVLGRAASVMYGSSAISGALVLSRVDYTVEVLLLFMIISIYYIYITSMINCLLIMLHVLYK